MARGDQLARQWKIIQALSAARSGLSAAQMADELGCHRRTLYRDLEALQSAGFPIYNDRREGQTRWQLLETVRKSMPLPLNLTELMALFFSRGMMRSLEHTFFWQAWESLFAKIKTMLPPETLAYLHQIERSLSFGRKRPKALADIGGFFDVIRSAIAEQRYLDMRYYTMSRKAESRRRVAPYKVWFFDGSLYLIADCALRGGIRLFALDRIKAVAPLEERFALPENFSADEFMKPSFGVFHGRSTRVRIRFSAAAADYIRERIWHESQVITPQEDGAVLFEARVAGTREIKFWIMQWGAQAEVLAPASLRREIREEAAAMLNTYAPAEPA